MKNVSERALLPSSNILVPLEKQQNHQRQISQFQYRLKPQPLPLTKSRTPADHIPIQTLKPRRPKWARQEHPDHLYRHRKAGLFLFSQYLYEAWSRIAVPTILE